MLVLVLALLAQPTDFYGITGQSYALGVGGSPALSIGPNAFGNKRVSGGQFINLEESSRESPRTAALNQLVALGGAPGDVRTAAKDGATYDELKKGSTSFTIFSQLTTQMSQTKNALHGVPLTVRAIMLWWGERSIQDGTEADVAWEMAQLRSDYDTDAKAITGQSSDVLMFHDQADAWPFYGFTTSQVPIQQLKVARDYPTTDFIVTPDYPYPSVDGTHLTNRSYQANGAQFGKVMRQVQQTGIWRPFAPIGFCVIGTQVQIKFAVPAPPLVFDTLRVALKANAGFELSSANGASISNVSITGPDTVLLDLTSAPSLDARVRYAYTGTLNAWSGPGLRSDHKDAGSARGNVRDSDDRISIDGDPLNNWLLVFDDPIYGEPTCQ